MVAVAIGGAAAAGLAGTAISAGASGKASSQQSAADMYAAQLQQQRYEETRNDLNPYNVYGQSILPDYTNFYKTSADQLGQAFSAAQDHIPQPMTTAQLEQTPGYQFALSQGLRSVQNSNAAKGLGVSSNALQSAAQYATGLAQQTYGQQFGIQQQIYQDYLNQLQAKQGQLATVFNQMASPVSLGESAAAQTGNIGANLAAGQANALMQAGIAQSAGTTGQANAISSGLNNTANLGLAYLGMQNALNSGGGGGFIDSGTF